jgi:hypothetical protein
MARRRKKKKRDNHTFIWNTYGDWVATLIEGHLYDLRGTWVGWVEENKDVYKGDGEWLGKLSDDRRILRKRTASRRPLREDIPDQPEEKPDLPVRAPLPPTFAELTFSDIDVLEEDPDAFKQISDLKPDMD